jgi:uncharacterized OB-fold protein
MSTRAVTVSCEKCGARYADTGRPCPNCNPRTVTQEEWAAREISEEERRPRWQDKSA